MWLPGMCAYSIVTSQPQDGSVSSVCGVLAILNTQRHTITHTNKLCLPCMQHHNDQHLFIWPPLNGVGRAVAVFSLFYHVEHNCHDNLCNATKPLNRPLVTTHNVRRSTMWSKRGGEKKTSPFRVVLDMWGRLGWFRCPFQRTLKGFKKVFKGCLKSFSW